MHEGLHRESCTVYATARKVRRQGCTCDLGHATDEQIAKAVYMCGTFPPCDACLAAVRGFRIEPTVSAA